MKPTFSSAFFLSGWLVCTITNQLSAAEKAEKRAARSPSESAYKSGIVKGGYVTIDADISGAKSLWLVVTPTDDGFGCDWADWGEARLVGPKGEVKLIDLKWRQASTGFGEVQINKNAAGRPLRIGGQALSDGIGTHAPSVITYDIVDMGFTRFKAKAGLDDGGTAQGCGSTVEFLVFTDRPPGPYLAMARDATAAASGERGFGPAAAKADAEKLIVPDGLEATLFASEPMLVNPTNLDIDARGRVWVTEGANYRRWATTRPGGDRIVILEDTNGDGAADSAKTFYQGTNVNSALGICVLDGKVIVSCSPNILVFTDADGDDKADGPPQILFSGIKGVQHDHGAHAFVFGPDGKLYFNLGNDGRELKTADGSNYIFDKAGNRVTGDGKPYRQGLVFRCDLDGSNVETLGWNFRNNYEVCVDSFGTLWQSDNDDDGNRAVRINYVMEFGNFGYQDEFTGKGWRDPRTNLEKEVPLQHWHLNDPGVVPNFLQTGAGSPTGICVYEGNLLPAKFRGQVIHCDAGPRTVRAYPATKDGAGYKGEMVDILTSTDSWYRPSDVCVAPDGSLLVSDWNDAGVGGHNMADRELEKMRGRIYRVAPKGHKLTVPKLDLKTAAGCVAALQSPNLATRHLAWTELNKLQGAAETELLKLWRGNDPRMRARALHLLARIKGKEQTYVEQALRDGDADIRITALRIARQTDWAAVAAADKDKLKKAGLNTALNVLGGALGGKKVTAEGALGELANQLNFDLLKCVNLLANDPSPQVRRECIIALRHNASPAMPKLWAHLARQHDGKDRWYLEALGIGADKRWDECFAAWLELAGTDWNTPAGRDIIWRSRAAKTPEYLAKLIKDSNVTEAERPRYFRAFDFQSGEARQKALVELVTWSTGR